MRVEYWILGPIAATIGGRTIAFGGARQRAVLAVLLINRNAVVSSDRLIDLVWGEDPPATAATALQGHVSKLRGLLGQDAIETRSPGYLLRTEAGAVDVDRFAELVAHATGAPPRAAARRLRDALDLVRGSFLTDLADEAFVEVEANRLEELRMSALEARIGADLEVDDAALVVPELETLVAGHPYRERLHALRMLALYRAGRQADALAAYQEARIALDEGLGIDPGPELQALEMAVLRQDPSLNAGPPGGTRAGNLPMPPSALVGRSAELASAKRQLAGPTRLLTLTGPGGIGKTRLALEIAWALADDVDGGAWFVDLEGATTPAAALSTIGSALGLPEVAEDDLLASLRDRTTGALLLVLDNLEQVPEIAGPLAELLAASPALRILATSRTPLQIRAEREHPLPPLATGGNGAGVPSDAVALFLERARAVDPSFDPGPAGLADVGRLCERLDGLPLAIELAAARVRLLSPAAILVRVEHSLDVLRSERRDLPGRQRSLEAAITWSVDLLTDTERRVFVPAAVFAGGFTLQAFEAVCAEPGDDALNLLEGLLRHSLIRRRDGQSGEPRFALLDTIRRFALDRLEHGADREVQARHGQYMTELAARLESSIGEPDETELILELREEHDNFVAALAWLESSGDDTAFVALAAASAPYWVRDSRYREGLGWIATALDRTSGGTPADRARLLRHRAALSSTQGDGRAALGYAMASVEAWEIVGDQHGLADALRVVAMTAADLGDLDAAGAAATRALSVAEAAGDPRLARDARHELAHVAVQRGDLAVGLLLLQANVDVLRRSGSRASLAATLGNLGMIHMEMGNLDQAEAVARESITMVRTLHDDANLASILTTLAEILTEQGRLEEAEACGRESLVAVLRAGAMRELPPILEMMGRINALRGDHGTAVRMVAVARSVRDAGAAPGQGPEVDALAPGARDALGEDAFEAAWRAGLATSPDQLLEELIGTGLAQEGVRTAAGPDQDRSGEPAAGGDRGHAHGEHEDAGAGKESQPEEALRRHHRGSVPS